jgi:hypothetical protein
VSDIQEESGFSSGFSEDIELSHVGIAIRDFPTGVLNRPSAGHVAGDPDESAFGESGFPETRDSSMLKSRSAISR